MVNPLKQAQGTVATLTLRHNDDRTRTVTNTILIWVRTEAERKQYQDLLDQTHARLFSPRDVKLLDGNQPGTY
jgi:hypothetical protein